MNSLPISNITNTIEIDDGFCSIQRAKALANAPSLNAADWVELTGLRLGAHRPYEVTSQFVRFIPWEDGFIEQWPEKDQVKMIHNNEITPLTFPCTPEELLNFVDMAPNFGSLDVPPMFRQIVKMLSNSRKGEAGGQSDGEREKSPETPTQYRARLANKKTQLKKDRVKNFLQVISNEEGISVSRVKQLIAEFEQEGRPSKASPFNGLALSARGRRD